MTPRIRPEHVADREALRHVNQHAFGQDDEANLVDALRDGGYARLSLVAEVQGEVVGHILFSELPIVTERGTVSALALAPLAVLPEYQRQGIGSALVSNGLEACRAADHRIVVVLGHPTYYPRFGFSTKLAEALASPFCGRSSWMALELVPGALDGVVGWVQYAPPFGLGTHLRPVHKADRAEWLRMRTLLWPDGRDEHSKEVAAFLATGSFAWSEAFAAMAVFVAVRPVGGLSGFLEASVRSYAEGCDPRPVGYVEGWYVDPDVRRQGVGKRLVAAAERWAVAQGCKEMASDAHLENAVSQEAHKAVGFEETDRLVHFRKALSGVQAEAANRPGVLPRLRLLGVSGSFAVCRLARGSSIPAWATTGNLFSVTQTADELSVVCRQDAVPDGVVCERDWRCLRVAGSLPFTLVGVLAALTTPMAKAGIGIFAFSTFDTDYLLIRTDESEQAFAALRAAGHVVESSDL
jgi:putative acetyltransferase